jgi:hypothetical protein
MALGLSKLPCTCTDENTCKHRSVMEPWWQLISGSSPALGRQVLRTHYLWCVRVCVSMCVMLVEQGKPGTQICEHECAVATKRCTASMMRQIRAKVAFTASEKALHTNTITLTPMGVNTSTMEQCAGACVCMCVCVCATRTWTQG